MNRLPEAMADSDSIDDSMDDSMDDSIDIARRLNAGCQCTSLDRARLAAELEQYSPGFHAEVTSTRPHLFSDSMVFVGSAHVKRMAALIAAIDRVVVLPAYQHHVLAWAPEIARHLPATRGVFLGYDFHVGTALDIDVPQLIEINTNAGGGLLNAVLARAQLGCCAEVQAAMDLLLPGALGVDTPEHLFLEMFRAEWKLYSATHRRPATASALRTGDTASRAGNFLQTVAIVDEAPQDQYLYPEFVLFQRLLQDADITAVICDPCELNFHDGALWHGTQKIDLVYNRLTDFSLEQPQNMALRDAYLADAVALTPHPHAHALYADKRNLVALTDADLLTTWGVDDATRKILIEGIPRTELVSPELADRFWARRRQLFFKPAAGYGSKAAYRGDKITRRVFDEVLSGSYVAQALVPPSSRTLQHAGESLDLKLDLRCYVYAGAVQLIAARLWQGQTTNFRTPGGGFAPVLAVPEPSLQVDAP